MDSMALGFGGVMMKVHNVLAGAMVLCKHTPQSAGVFPHVQTWRTILGAGGFGALDEANSAKFPISEAPTCVLWMQGLFSWCCLKSLSRAFKSSRVVCPLALTSWKRAKIPTN
eukprot:3581939-Amphidinium_carterae.1